MLQDRLWPRPAATEPDRSRVKSGTPEVPPVAGGAGQASRPCRFRGSQARRGPPEGPGRV